MARATSRRRLTPWSSPSQDAVCRPLRAARRDETLELVKIDLSAGNPVGQLAPEAHLEGSLQAPEEHPYVFQRMCTLALSDAHLFVIVAPNACRSHVESGRNLAEGAPESFTELLWKGRLVERDGPDSRKAARSCGRESRMPSIGSDSRLRAKSRREGACAPSRVPPGLTPARRAREQRLRRDFAENELVVAKQRRRDRRDRPRSVEWCQVPFSTAP